MSEKKYTYEELGQISFMIITFAGTAKSDAMLAIYSAKKYDFGDAKKKLESAEKNMIEAEKQHADLVQKEAAGVEIKIPLLLMHAEDQLLSTQTLMLMAEEFVNLYEKLFEMEKK
ncbi:MAG: PTS lactose/cellobiose transporter subunit IIA [Metamycoplasmataceae bacterium]